MIRVSTLPPLRYGRQEYHCRGDTADASACAEKWRFVTHSRGNGFPSPKVHMPRKISEAYRLDKSFHSRRTAVPPTADGKTPPRPSTCSPLALV